MTHAQQFPSSAIGNGYELVHRTAIVRLGPGMCLIHTDNHASLGITEIYEDNDQLVVVTDFGADELILSVTANPDATLVLKGVTAGASGGSALTRFTITSCRALPYGSASTKPAFTKLHPQSAVFDSVIDNLWINFLSIRPTTEGCAP